MKTYTVKGEMRWEGVYTVCASSPEEAVEKIRSGEWEDWQPQNLCDWEATGEPELEST